MIHQPVLLKEVIDNLNLRKGITVVDATLGAGGYSQAILKKIGKEGTIIAIDKDEKAIKNFQKIIKGENIKNIKLFQGNYSQIQEFLKKINIKKVDVIVADLGLSSDQLADVQRGFSFQHLEAPLDMRMNQSQTLTADKIINYYSEKKLAELFQKYGNEKFSWSIAQSIVQTRQKEKIKTVGDLLKIIKLVKPSKFQHQKIHWATKIFQALRIEVNQELEQLKYFLRVSLDSLKKGGRLAVVSFHSGEDKIVKNIFRENARGCICPKEFPVCRCGHKAKIKIITRHTIKPSKEEIENNPRARSAKLRVVEKI